MRSSPTSRKKAMYTSRRIRMLPSGLDLRKAPDTRRDIAVVAGIGLELEVDRQRSRGLVYRLEQFGELVQQPMSLVGGRCWRLRRTLVPLDRLSQHAPLAMYPADERRRLEAQPWRPRRRFQSLNDLVELSRGAQCQSALVLLVGLVRPARRLAAEPFEHAVQISGFSRRDRRRRRTCRRPAEFVQHNAQ